MIAHRLATIPHPQLILVMHHRSIVERRTHEGLVARAGPYQQPFDIQTMQPPRPAPRPPPLRHAALILVMHHGWIVGRGTHEELVARAGLYNQLFDMQTMQSRRRTRLPPVQPAAPSA